jgi:hypothetical protein
MEVMIDGQSASLSSYEVTIWDLGTIFLSHQRNLSSDSGILVFLIVGRPF